MLSYNYIRVADTECFGILVQSRAHSFVGVIESHGVFPPLCRIFGHLALVMIASQRVPLVMPRFADDDHLARLAEWNRLCLLG